MSYQFIHIQPFSRVAGASRAGGKNAGQILDEAARIEGNHPHVQEPHEPILLFGESIDELRNSIEKWAEQATDARGYKLRKDGHCLLGGVISMPKEYEGEKWDAYKKDAVDWLKTKYGPALRTVVEHTDEGHPHVHFYAVPEHGKQFDTLHEGQRAAKALKNEKKGVQNQAYKEAMRGYQDQFFRDLSVKHGMSRIGPGRRRLTREAWVLEKKQARAYELTKKSTKKLEQKHRERGHAKGLEQGRAEGLELAKSWGESIGGFFKGVLENYHKPTQQAKEAENAALARLTEQQEQHQKTLEKQQKAFKNEIEKSEEARKELVERTKILEKNMSTINEKFGPYIREQLTAEKKAKEVKEQEEKRQREAKEEAERKARKEREMEHDRGWDPFD